MSTSHFEPDPLQYDALIDWPRRLERETPFYRRLFADVGVSSVLDAACGTGRHANMFHDWGLRVVGADISPAMLAYCRQNWGEHDTLNWVERPFDRPHDPPATFDAAICVGNSLAIASNAPAAAVVVAALAASVRPGGAIVVQVLNLWQFEDGPTVWQKCRRVTDGSGDRILLKGIHRRGQRGFVDMVSVDLSGGGAAPQARSAVMLGLEADALREMAARAGLEQIELLGDYERSAYRRESSQDLILVARRQR